MDLSAFPLDTTPSLLSSGRLCTQGKAASKAAIQKEAGLDQRPDAPLIGFVGRLDEQKGVDLIIRLIPHLVKQVMIEL